MVSDLKLLGAAQHLLPRQPRRWLEYMAYYALRLTFTLLLLPRYRREELTQRRLLTAECLAQARGAPSC
jgi:hypothetical protein